MKKVTDVHVHLVALPEADNGCFISPRMMRSLPFRVLVWKLGMDLARPPAANVAYVERLLRELGRSQKVGKAVLLALDAVYDHDGRLDRTRTDFLISNRYVLQVARRRCSCPSVRLLE